MKRSHLILKLMRNKEAEATQATQSFAPKRRVVPYPYPWTVWLWVVEGGLQRKHDRQPGYCSPMFVTSACASDLE